MAGRRAAGALRVGETEDDGADRTADGQGAGIQPRDAQRQDRGDDDEDQPQQEARGAGRARVHAPQERRRGEASEVPRQRPAENHHDDGGGHAHGRVDPEDPFALHVGAERQREQREQRGELPLRAPGALGGLQRHRARSRGDVWST
ncbi:hypothetical protein OM076_32740 [Solirubrobacter ginsenosidimutans]|uniref:Uncharacterized protein n=1 Tax=Solirubrobacter ginsenosidimutans TaxID=490573 RepID=A0A9X3N590_9ACTN|nr:hypothetical protein [Solirubrobacter ginsenosidimutans]MDA0165083.1 hypothetical protein [Solirubrobacter ginsenosidimutans]